jgi:hypothetical protein
MRGFISLLLPFFASFVIAQEPVKWSGTYKPITTNSGEIIITANIEKGWHIYSQRPTDAGPIPTSFTFASLPLPYYRRDGKVEEINAHEEFDKAFEAKIFVFTDHAEFRQKIILKGKPGFIIPVKLEYMSCNDMMCLPPKTVDVSVKTQ